MHLCQEGCYLLKGVASDIIHRLSFGAKVFARRGTVLIEEGQENSAIFVVGHSVLIFLDIPSSQSRFLFVFLRKSINKRRRIFVAVL